MQRASQSSAVCACRKYPGGCTTGQVKAVEATAHPWGLHPGPSTRVADVMPLHHIHLFVLRIVLCARLEGLQPLDTLGFEPRAFRMRSGCDTTTPCALEWHAKTCCYGTSPGASGRRALRWDSSPLLSVREEDVLPLRQVASDSAAREEDLLCASSTLCVRRASQSSALCYCLKYPGVCTTGQVNSSRGDCTS